jgi:anti-sigma regulatory factor (Ser/Thr protein kinase)
VATPEALLVLRVKAVPDVLPETRHKVREHLQQHGVEAPAVELALPEAVGNVVLHAYPQTDPGEVEVVVIVDDDAIEVVVRDRGVGLDPDPEFQGPGHGVQLMQALADRFEFDGQPGAGTTVRMEFDRTSE